MKEIGTLNNFYSSTIKSHSARHPEKKKTKNRFNETYFNSPKNKILNINTGKYWRNLDNIKAYKTIYNIKLSNSTNNSTNTETKRNFSSRKKGNCSLFSSFKTESSTLPTSALTSRNFMPKAISTT